MMKIVPLLFVIMLSGCGAIQAGFGEINYGWHSNDLDTFVKANYPEGSDENILIHDFTIHKYKLSDTQAPCSARHCAKILSVPAYCSWFFGAWAGSEIWWVPDDNGKITELRANRTQCLLAP